MNLKTYEEKLNYIKNYLIESTESNLPDSNRELVEHFIHTSEVIEEFIDLKIPNEKEITKFIFQILWCWHNTIREYHYSIRDELYCYSYILSWANLSRILYKILSFKKLSGNLIINHRALDFKFVIKISKYENLVSSHEIINNYSLKDLTQMIRLLWPCLYKFPFSKEMAKYFHALAMKNLSYNVKNQNEHDFFPRYQKKKSNQRDDEEDYDYNDIEINFNDGNYILKSSFIFESELILYPQFKRFSICKILLKNSKSFQHKNDIYIEMFDIFQKIMSSLVLNEFFKQTLLNDFKTNITQLYLFHGEYERFKRENKNSIQTIHSDDVLRILRSSEYGRVCNISKNKIPSVIIEEYIKLLKSDVSLEGYQFRPINLFEREIIYISYLSIDKYFKSYYKNINLNDIFLSELFFNLNKISSKVNNIKNEKYKVPCIINIMHLNFVINYSPVTIFFSHYFIESFILWINLLNNQKIIKLDSIENEHLKLFGKFKDIFK